MSVRNAMIQLREELQMRQVDLASALGVSSITVIRWETEKNIPSRAMSLAIVGFAKNRRVSTVCQEALELALLHSEKEPEVDDLRFAQLAQINSLVNDSSNGILVSDAKTYEILYVNQQMGAITGKKIELASKMNCHEFLFGQQHPCDFCQICGFSNEEYTTGEYESPKTGRYYVSRGKLIWWNDRKAHIEYISDMTEFRSTQKSLEHHRELLSLACENAQMWVFLLDIQTGDVHLDKVVQKALNLPKIVPNFIETMVQSDSMLSPYMEEFEDAIIRLKNGEELVELTVQTQIHSKKQHWVRFRAKTVEWGEDGTPQTAACSAQVIDEEVAFRTRIRFEQEYFGGKHTTKIMEGLLSASLQNGYEALGAMSLLRNQIARLQFSEDGIMDEEALEFASYDEETVEYCEHFVIPEQRQTFLQAVSIETLQRELKHKNVYSVSYKELGADGMEHQKIAQYTLYDKKRQFCLLSVLDLEKLTESIQSVDVVHTEAVK